MLDFTPPSHAEKFNMFVALTLYALAEAFNLDPEEVLQRARALDAIGRKKKP